MSLFLAGRTLRAVLLVFVVSSAALLLVHLAPGDPFDGPGTPPRFAEAERARLGLNRPFLEQYRNVAGQGRAPGFRRIDSLSNNRL